MNTSGSSVGSDRSDESEKFQSDPEGNPPEESYLKMGRSKSRKPGKKAMVPKKWANIYARKKGRDLYYLYKFLGKGTKNTKEGLRNPWMNVQTMDGEEVGFRKNDVAPRRISNRVVP